MSAAGACLTDVLVRPAEVSDLPTLVAYNQAMAKETEDLSLPYATVERGVRAILEGHAGGAYYVIESAGSVVAQLMITYEWSDWRARPVWWVQSVYVRPDSRRRGHFRKLYTHVREQARDAGAAGVRLYADAANTSAHATYQKLGMTSHYKVFEDMFDGG